MISIQDLGSDAPQEVPLGFGAVLAAAGCVMTYVVLTLAKHLLPDREPVPVPWGFAVLLPVVGIWLLGQVVVPLLWASLSGSAEFSLNAEFIMMLVIFAGPSWLIFGVARRAHSGGLRDLGFRKDGNLRPVLFGLAAYTLLIPALLAGMLLWPALLQALGETPQTQAVMQSFFGLEGSEIVLPLIFAVLILPFFEELFFRAFLQPLLVQKLRPTGGVVVTSLLFGAMHGLSALGPVFLLSLIMGGVMQRTRRFAACYCIHALHNGLTLWAVLTFSDVREMVDLGGAWIGWLGIA
jgi:membrane protease YdiL (CAAX protease family)